MASPSSTGSAPAPTHSIPSAYEADAAKFGLTNLFIIDIVLCALSTAGGLAMIMPFLLSSQWRTKIRHKLIFGLGISDLCIALTILIPSADSLAGNRINNGAPSCVAGAAFYVGSVLTSSFWALGIATVTYFILVHPLSRFTTYLSRPSAFYIYFALVWIVSGIVAAVAAGVFTDQAVDVGGFCSFSGQARLFGQMVLFVPRATVFTITIFLYARLFFFFRRKESFAVMSNPDAHLDAGMARFYSRTADVHGASADDGYDPSRLYGSPRDSLSSKAWYRRPSALRQSTEKLFTETLPINSVRRWSYPRSKSTDATATSGLPRAMSPGSPTRGRKASKDSNKTLIDDTMRMQPLAEKLAQRRSTVPAPPPTAALARANSRRLDEGAGVPWAEVKWRQPGDLATRRAGNRNSGGAAAEGSSTAPGLTITAPSSPAWMQGEWNDSGMISPTNVPSRPPLSATPSSAGRTRAGGPESPKDGQANSRRWATDSRESSDSSISKSGESSTGDDTLAASQHKDPLDGFPFYEDSPDLDDLQLASSRTAPSPYPTGTTLLQMGQSLLPRLEEVETPPGSPENGVQSRPRMTAPIIPNDFLSPAAPRLFSASHRDFNPATPTDRRRSSTAVKAIAGLGVDAAGGTAMQGAPQTPETSWQTGGSEEERIMSAQEMNRKASMLMLLYPLAYLLLFSVSIARVIIELIHNAPADPVLKGLSKWLILSAGWVDALIFMVIEWSFRRTGRTRS